MTIGVIQLNNPDVPADAPPPLAGESPWYSGQVLPVQVGVYKRLSVAGLVMYSYFDGAHWLWMHCSADVAVRAPSAEHSLCQTLPWRGLCAAPGHRCRPIPTLPRQRGLPEAAG